ncbi:MAG: hypothetical protein JWP87_5472 [Labilithrix sp.]|nr:hypothetical protein [Labilithrix sp.]
MSALRVSSAPAVLALFALLGACRAEPARPAVASPPPRSALPQLLAVAACPEVADRVVTLATGNDGIVDAFALVKRCTATPADGDVELGGDAWVWVAVDRDLGAVRVRQFVHAALHAELRLGVRAAFVGDHLELSLSPRPGAKASIEPVGALEVSPLNWAGLLAVELAPSAGTSVEWVAKRRLREETEAALIAAIAQPLVFAYDSRRAESWVVGSSSASRPSSAAPRVRVVPRGTALLGPYPETDAIPDVRLRMDPGARVAVRTVCRSHAERLLENDRRGDAVDVTEWTVASGEARPALPRPPCPWMLAMRSLDESGAVVSTEVVAPHGDASASERGHRWISLDLLEIDGEAGELPADLQLAVSTDVFRRSLVPAAKQRLPAVIELSADESAWIRAVRPGRDGAPPAIVARARLPLDTETDVDTVVDVTGDAGRVARVHVRARVREAR